MTTEGRVVGAISLRLEIEKYFERDSKKIGDSL